MKGAVFVSKFQSIYFFRDLRSLDYFQLHVPGFETARCLLLVGAKVYITCRSKSKVDETIAKLKGENSSADVEGLVMELSSLQSVRACAEQFLQYHLPLNVLINNAGVMACPLERTVDGYELQVRMSYLNPFAFH